jgi:hypothetical protein
LIAAPRRRWWLALPPLLLCCLDGALTLAGQPGPYWQGDFTAARELNPFFDLLLRWHPWAFLGGLAVWLAAIAGAIVWLPRRFAVVVAFGFTLGHACGAASWVVPLGVAGWVLAVLLLVAAERLLWLSWRRACC